MRVSEVMVRAVRTATKEENAEAAFFRMQRDAIHHLVVMNGATVEGVITTDDLGGHAGEAVRRGRTVGELMTKNPAVATPDMTMREAANQLRGRSIGCLPVMQGDRLLGIVTASDVCNWVGSGKTRTQRKSTTRSGRRFHPGTGSRHG